MLELPVFVTRPEKNPMTTTPVGIPALHMNVSAAVVPEAPENNSMGTAQRKVSPIWMMLTSGAVDGPVRRLPMRRNLANPAGSDGAVALVENRTSVTGVAGLKIT